MNTPTPETDAVWEKMENILDHARKLERERDEALRLVASLTATAHMQAGIMEAELELLTEARKRNLGEHLAAMLKQINGGESK